MPRWLMELPHRLVTVGSFVLSFAVVLAIWALSGHFSLAFHGKVDWPVRTGATNDSTFAPTWLLYVVFPSVVLWVAFMARYEQAWINEHAPDRGEAQEEHPAERG